MAANVDAMIVPGSGLVRKQAEKEGLDRVFKDAGFDWREAGCSMCLGMNPDQLKAGERCASTSNRNFEGRQGAGGRTHLMSPAMAAAAAIAGKFTDVRKYVDQNTEAEQPDSKRAKLDAEVGSDVQGEQPAEAPVDEVTDGEAQSAGAPPEPTSVPAGVPKFTTLKGIAAPLAKSNVDTDAIIPKVRLASFCHFYSERLCADGVDPQPVHSNSSRPSSAQVSALLCSTAGDTTLRQARKTLTLY